MSELGAITPANRALLERKFGRKIPDSPDAKVTVTIAGLCSILDAARGEAKADGIERTLDAAIGAVRENRREVDRGMESIREVFRRAGVELGPK